LYLGQEVSRHISDGNVQFVYFVIPPFVKIYTFPYRSKIKLRHMLVDKTRTKIKIPAVAVHGNHEEMKPTATEAMQGRMDTHPGIAREEVILVIAADKRGILQIIAHRIHGDEIIV